MWMPPNPPLSLCMSQRTAMRLVSVAQTRHTVTDSVLLPVRVRLCASCVAELVKDNHLRSLPRAMNTACSAVTARSSDADEREGGGEEEGGGGGCPLEPMCVAHFISTSRARHAMDGNDAGHPSPGTALCAASLASPTHLRAVEGQQDCGDAFEEGDVPEVQWARPVNGISAQGLDAVRGRATVIHEGCELEKAWQVGVNDRSVCVRVRVPVERLGDDPIMKSEQHTAVWMSVRTKVLCCFLFACIIVTIFIVRQMSARPGSSGKKA